MRVLAIFFLVILSAGSIPGHASGRCDSTKAEQNFLGTWILVQSLDSRQATISLPFKSPVAKVVVERRRDDKVIRGFPEKIRNIIRKNQLGRIRMIEFDTSGSTIDTAYIGASIHGDSLIFVASYSRKTKKFYDITKLTLDTMIVGDRDYYLKRREDSGAERKNKP